MRRTCLILIFFLTLGLMTNAAVQTAKAAEALKTTNIIAISELFSDQNQALEKQYKGKFVTVQGYAVKVGPDIFGLPSIEISDSPDGEMRALCVLPFSDYLKLSDISVNQLVTVQAEYRTRTKEGYILLKQSTVLK